MAKNDNPHAIRLLDSFEKHAKPAEAVRFSEAHPLSKAAAVQAKFE